MCNEISGGIRMNNIGTKTIETEQLILRRFEYDDTKSVLKNWASDEEVQSLYSEPVYKTEGEVKELLKKYIDCYKSETYYRWAICLKDSNECIGQIAYFMVNEQNHFAEIEYCIGRFYQGKGYATEAAKAIIGVGFNEIDLHKVQISHKALNEKSKRVIEKCGLKYEGTLRDFFYVESENKYIDRLYYSILREEYDLMCGV